MVKQWSCKVMKLLEKFGNVANFDNFFISVSGYARAIDAELLADLMECCFRSCIAFEFPAKNAVIPTDECCLSFLSWELRRHRVRYLNASGNSEDYENLIHNLLL